MKNCDCLFVFPPGGEYELEHFSYSLGSGYVIAYLRKKGVNASQFYCNERLSADACAARILQHLPKVVGFTVFNTNFISCLLIAEKIKKYNSSILIVFGGPTASNYATFIASRYACVDICIRNEAEETFHELYERLSSRDFRIEDSILHSLRGITYEFEGNLRHNPDADILLTKNNTANYLDTYPSPYLTGVIPAEKAWLIGMVTARGCNQNCVYCNCAVLSKRKFSMHSVERVVGEIEYLSAFLKENKLLNIFDDAFTLVPNRAKQICRMIIENRIKVKLGCLTRCDCVDDEMLDLMKAAGFISVGFSLESAVPRILRIIGKVRPAEDTPSGSLEREEKFVKKLNEVTTYARKIGIPNIYSSIMIGLPTETLEEANRTVQFIDNSKSIDSYTHNVLSIYRGTPLHNNYKKYDYKIEKIGGVPIFAKTRHPTEIASQVKISTKSQIYRKRNQGERDAIKILSLIPQRASAQSYFDNLILLSDRLHKNIVEWMKDSVSIHACILQLYSSKSQYARHFNDNLKMLYRCYSPSLNLHNYFISEKAGWSEIISSYSMALRDADSEDNLKMGDTGKILKQYDNGCGINFNKMICQDRTLADSYDLLRILKKLSGITGPFDYLAGSRPMPYFSGLCKWSSAGANCETFETAIVDAKGDIRLCWTGKPVGRVGDAFPDIVNRVNELRYRTRESRECPRCQEGNNCIKCINPDPISSQDYCLAVNTHEIGKQADLLRSFHLLSEYLNP